MAGLDTVLDTESIDDHKYLLRIPEGWEQGASTFGGLVIGAMVRAMTRTLDDGTRSLRTLNAELIGAVQAGDAILKLRTLRQGNAVSALSVECSQGDELVVHAVGIFGRPRPFDETWRELPPPVFGPWQETRAAELDASIAPRFTRQFEYRPIFGAPFEGGSPRCEGWVRPREICSIRDEAYISAIADAWWLAAMVKLASPRPAATLCFSIDFHSPIEGLGVEAPLYHRGYVSALSDGYATEVRELWGQDGRLVSINRQVVVIIK